MTTENGQSVAPLHPIVMASALPQTLPKPYFEKQGITIYHGDARSILPHLPKKSIDAVITDPPFFMPATHYQSRTHWQRRWGDTSVLGTFWSVIVEAALPSMKPTGHFLTFCNHESYPVFYPEMYCRFDVCKAIVWDKEHFGMGRVWRNQHELIIASRWADSEFIDDGKTRADVLRHKATRGDDRLHPVEKPESLLADLIMPTVPEGGMVLDMFAGSGSTLRAALECGRKAIGIEIEEKYCEVVAKRLAQGVLF